MCTVQKVRGMVRNETPRKGLCFQGLDSTGPVRNFSDNQNLLLLE